MNADSTTTRSRTDRRAQVRAILTGSVPNLVQWFNLYVYATFAPYFRTEFFDPHSADSLVWVYALFAVTFLVRPLGSWIFGRLADTGGRERALVTAVTLMSAASLVLAATPTERVIGVWAAVVLVVVSVVQGVAAGGGYAAAAVLLSESGTRGRRGFFSSFQGATIVGGLVLAQGLLLVLLLGGDRADVAAWGWRVAFAASGLAGLVSLWWARSARRSARTASKGGASTMSELFRGYWRPLLWVILLTAGGSAAFYTATVTVPYLIRETFFADGGATAERASTGLVLAAFVILMLLQPLGGALSDRIGRKPLLVVFGVGGVLGAGALVTAAARVTSPAAVFAVLVLAFAVLTCYLSVNGIAKAEVFPAHIRALGVGFGYAVSNSLFGGTAPLMFHATGGGVGFIVYLTVLLAVTAGAAIAMRGGVGTVLDAPPGATAPKP